MMRRMRRMKMIIGAVLVIALVLGNLFVPLQSAFAYSADGAQDVKRGSYYDLPETVEKYVTSGKTLEFDLNFKITNSENCKLRLYDGATQVSAEFLLRDGENGLGMTIEQLDDGWFHYILTLSTVPHSESQASSSITRIRVATNFPTGAKINNISVGVDVSSLPENFTSDYDTVTLADLGIAGIDYETAVSSGTYTYKGTSATKSVIVSFGWDANITSSIDWKLALDTYWNANCMVWFRPDKIYFCPGDGDYRELQVKADPVTSGKHEVQFGRLRVEAGPHAGNDYVFLKIDGEVKAYQYTKYYQTEGGYVAYNSKVFSPSYTVCFVNDGVSSQGFSGFAEPDQYVSDIDNVNIGDIVPGGVVKDTVHENYLGYSYPFTSVSESKSTVVKFILKTGKFAEGNLDGSVMVVDIGGNCGFCRSYISAGNKKSIMFGWEIEGCTSSSKSFAIKENSWYAFEQGRLRITSGANKGKDYVYLKIDGKTISSFYGNPESRPRLGEQIYVEATESFQILGYDALQAKYYVDDELYLDDIAQKGFAPKQPADPKKDSNYFVGWYTAKTGGTLFDFANTKLTEDISLYARFTTETVTATFDPSNGNATSDVTAGKNCLVKEPAAPSYSGGEYEHVFVGWKNVATGKLFNFSTDRLTENATFVAQYKEKEYFVSYYANGALVEKVPFVLSNPTVSGKEPAVPAVPNTTGVWEDHSVSGLTGNKTVNAIYTVTVPTESSAVKLTAYAGGKVYLNTDILHDYLSTESKADQTTFVREYCSAPHEYQDHQNTIFQWTDTGKNNSYTVYFADNTNFENAYIYTTDKTLLENEVGIFVPGKTYYWFVCGNDTGKCSAIDNFVVINTPVRYITAGHVINMRDLGGQVNSNGDKVKYELVYRGAALDEYTSHVDDVARGVFNYLGINSEIELRGGMQHDNAGWDDSNPNTNYIKGAMYQEILDLDSEQKAQYKATFESMADINNYPYYFHCSAGADRTGTFAYLLYGLLGISYDDIRPEYELTSFSAIGLRPGNDYHNGQSLDQTHQDMLEQYGNGTGDLQTAVRNFLTSYIGVSNATLDAIQNIMLDKNASPNEKALKLTVDVLGKEYTYRTYAGIYFMPDSPQIQGKIFKGFYNGSKKYDGYTDTDLALTAKFDDMQYDDYDTITLLDLGVQEEKIYNQTNKVYTYKKTAKSGGRLFRFIMEPIDDMKKGDGPQLALTNDWEKNSAARIWFQSNETIQIYYNGVLNAPPDITKMFSLEAGKQYAIEYAVRVLKNKGYEGTKVFEVTINGELVVQYIGCTADLSENMIYFHGSEGAAYLSNLTDYKIHILTVNVEGETFNYPAFEGVYSMPDTPKVAGKVFKGFYNGSTKYNGYATKKMTLVAKFEDMQYEAYDTVTLRDLGVQEEKILNPTNTVYTYKKTAKSGGRLLRFIMEPIGDMKGGDGPQISFINDWEKNSTARIWFQSNETIQVYYNGVLNTPPDITKLYSFEPGKQYEIEYSIRILKNAGYKGKKVFEVTVNGELIVQYFDCKADLSENKFYFHGSAGAAYLSNLTDHKIYTLTIDVQGKKFNYPAFEGVYSMPDSPQVAGKIFKGFYSGSTKYKGYANKKMNLVAKFEDMKYEKYDTVTLRDLGVQEEKILNPTNTVYTYKQSAKSGGRLLRFIMEPIGDMKGGDGPQISFTNDWEKNSAARIWFQSNEFIQVYYSGKLNMPPDISKKFTLEAGEQYEIEYAIRILKNEGYEGKKVLEVTVNGELIVQYFGCKADLSENKFYFHGSTGAAYLSNLTNHKIHTLTIDVEGKKFNYPAFEGVYSMPDSPQVAGKIFKGFYSGSTKYNGYATKKMNLVAKFENMKYEAYDTVTLRDLGVQEEKILNPTNTVYTYKKTAKSGGRLLRFIMEPIGDMKKGDGPQISFINDWEKNSAARIWFQSNEFIQVYYSGKLNMPPDITKKMALEDGKQYKIEYSIRILKNKGYEGKKVLEVTVNGELIVQYFNCKADLSENKFYFHGSEGAAYLSNLTNYKIHTLTVDVMGKKFNYPAFEGVYSMPDTPQVAGKVFKGFYNGKTKYNGYATGKMNLTAKFENMQYEPYDTITLRDLGVQEEKILNPTNTLYTYKKTAKSGGRLLRFVMEPIGDMKGGDGPQVALTNDWEKNSAARIWFQSNDMIQVYYHGVLNSPPSLSKKFSLEAGQQYHVEFSVRILKNKGYEGKKVLEVTVNGELIVQYFDCTADLSENKIYFHGSEGAAYLSNLTKYKIHTITVDVMGKKFNYPAFEGVYSMPDTPQVAGKVFKGFYNGKTKYNGYANKKMSVVAKFEDMQYEDYDTLTLRDLGVQEEKILNLTNTVYTYEKTAKSGGRLLRFIMEPIGDMKGGDGPQISFTNDWEKNSAARIWFQNNELIQIYYSGKLNTPPDITKKMALEAGKQYKIEYSIRILKNKGYEGKKVLEVTVNGELVVQYFDCTADLSENKFYFHGSEGAAYLSNLTDHKIYTLTVDVLGKTFNYPAFEGVYSMPDTPQVAGKLFTGFYCDGKKYDGYAKGKMKLVAAFEDMEYEPYDTITLRDLGVEENKILNQTNTVYTYEKTAESGGRLLQFIMEPIGDMKGGDGPQVALTNDWEKNSAARVWFQSNDMIQVYYHGVLNSPPSLSEKFSLESGKQYKIKFSIRILKNKGYEGKKVFEVTVNDQLIVQYFDCTADLSENMIYFHGGTGAAYLINDPVYKTVKFYNGDTLLATKKVERCSILPKVDEPAPQNGLPFAGWYTEKTGGTLWDENADLVYNNMNLYAHFANVRVITADVDGKTFIYRVEVGKTLDELPKPQKAGHVFMGWMVNGKLFTGKVTEAMNITAAFEAYSFDEYDEISLRDLGISGDLDFAIFGDRHTAGYTYHKAAKTGGRLFKAIYVPTENMINGPQVSFSTKWDENYFAKLYFTKYDKLYVYSSGIDGGLPTLNMDTELTGGKEYLFEIAVRVLNNKGYKGIKVLTVTINGEQIFEEFDNKAPIDGDTVFFQGLPNTGIFRNINIYKTVSFYDGDDLLSSAKVLRGEKVASIGNLSDKGDQLFKGWFTEYGNEWSFDTDCVYLDTVLKSRYEKRTYPVLLMVDDVLYKRLNVAAGECVEIFDSPTKDGYEFDKWLNEEGGEYDMQTPVNAPVVLSASFKAMAAKSSSDKGAKPLATDSDNSSNLPYILFSVIGLAVIGAESGLIVFTKKRSKRS